MGIVGYRFLPPGSAHGKPRCAESCPRKASTGVDTGPLCSGRHAVTTPALRQAESVCGEA
ncbi:hypothetical protein GT354_42080 [Streptomyces sp. SID3343]|nr:hypothetical protein [Streptomyces sp. SID3343]